MKFAKKEMDRSHYYTFQTVFWSIIILLVMIFFESLILSRAGVPIDEAVVNAFRIVTHFPFSYGSFFLTLFSILGAFLGVYIIFTFLSILFNGALNSEVSEGKKMLKMKQLKNHVIICGTNLVSSNIAVRLDADNKPFVIVGTNKEYLQEAKEKKFLSVDANPLDEDVLIAAGVENAALVLSVLDTEGDNVLLTLMAKKLNPKLKVVAKSNHYRYAEHLEKVGADLVMMPEVLGAFKIADVAKDILEL